MLRIFADNHHHSVAANYLAFLAYFLDGRFNFHFVVYSPFHLKLRLFSAPRYPPFGQVIDRNLDGDAVAGQDPDIIHPELTRYMRGYNVPVWQFHFKSRVWQTFHHNAFELDYIIFWQNNHSPREVCFVLKNRLCLL